MRLSVNRAGPVAPARSTSRRVVFALCALWCSTVTPLLAQHLNDTGQGNCHHATASIRTPDPETAGFDAQNCTHEVAATVDAASAMSASPQASPRGMPEKPAGLDDAGWDSLQQAIRKAAVQQAKLSGDGSLPGGDGAASDDFGYSVALDGDTALVGAYRDDVGANSDQGSAYVFTRSGSTWTQQAKLTAGDGAASDYFGYSVALDGDTALVGAVSDGALNINPSSAYVFTRSGNTWTQQAKLVAGDGASNDYFGASVALDGNTALVGAIYDDVGVNGDQGSAYVFTRSGSTWTQQAKLVAGDGAIIDHFGFSVTLDGDTALVGAIYDTVGVNSDQGSAYVFTRSGATWTQQAKLVAGDGAAGDTFGNSVALDGDTALVGVCRDDVGANSDQGSAYVFTRSGSTWTQQAKLTAGDGAEGDFFGSSVALDGDTTLVGANYDDVSSSSQGSAYVFTRSGSTWIQQAKVTAGDATARALLGWSVALDGDTALVGAYADDVGAISDQGSAYVFTHSGSTWTHQAELTAGNGATGDWFGDSVALDGDTALVGAYTDDVGANSDQGSAYVFTRSGNMWTQEAKLTADDGAAGDWFGYSVVLDGDTALVGATYDDVSSSNQGSAYVFTRSGTKWMQQAKLTAGDGATYDQFGWSVALDGDTALVGAYADNVGTSSDQGSAYVFTRSDNTWAQEAKLTAGDGAAYDQFGWSVAFDGETALVGAYADNVGANRDQGSAYVFTRSGTTWTQEAKLTAGDGAAGDFFGNSVALDVNTAILGAVGDTSDQGSAYVFTRIGTAWMQQAKLAAVDGATYSQFGWSVAVDGDTALVAAYAEKVGANIDQGSAYVFTRSGSTWTQLAKLTAGDGAASDVFGRSVALSSTTVLVGAPNVDGLPPYGNPDEGAAYVFRIVRAMFANGFEEPVRAITVPRL